MADSTITPALLLSMPQLNDPNFGRTIVLLCEFAEEGAFGLVLNRPTRRVGGADSSISSCPSPRG